MDAALAQLKMRSKWQEFTQQRRGPHHGPHTMGAAESVVGFGQWFV
jgi:hypothetical protein